MTSPLTVEVVDTAAGFDLLHDEWNTAAAAAANPNVFLTWEWLHTWWRHFGEDRSGARLHVVLVRDDEGIVAAAPWFRARPGVGPVHATVLQQISHDAGDYGGIVLVRRHDEAVDALLTHLAGETSSGTSAVVLSRLASDSVLPSSSTSTPGSETTLQRTPTASLTIPSGRTAREPAGQSHQVRCLHMALLLLVISRFVEGDVSFGIGRPPPVTCRRSSGCFGGAPAATAWGEHADRVACPELDRALVGEAFGTGFVPVREEPVLPHRARLTAPKAPRL